MNIVEKMIDEKIVDNGFHASGMLNVLECIKLDTDEQRLDRCRLYLAWQKYFAEAKTYTNKTNAKIQARINAIAGSPVPELPILAYSSEYFTDLDKQAKSLAEQEAEFELCDKCLKATGYESYGTSFAGDEPIPCQNCGETHWKLNVTQGFYPPHIEKEIEAYRRDKAEAE